MQSGRNGKRCLLVVEDDANLLAFFARVAEREGFRVELAQSGDQGLLVLKKLGDAIDALLTDIQLHGQIDGWALGSEFSGSHPDRSVIYVSGTESDRGQRGANTLFLQKPVHVSNLVAVLRQVR